MRRLLSKPRPDWQQQCEDQGFIYHSVGGTYWDESACYAFSLEQIEMLEDAANDLHQRCLQAVDWVIRYREFEHFHLDATAIDAVCRSWRAAEPALYGRFDFSWDGHSGAPKLLEYNADTPTGLLEASVIQWHWLEQLHPDADQFNSLHEALIARWREIAPPGLMHFSALDEHQEDTGNLLYLQETARQAGIASQYLPIEQIGFDPLQRAFVDREGRAMRYAFKLYPWEWLLADDFAARLPESGLRLQEPAWKLLMSSKALLPVLSRLFPDHPNLLKASFSADLPLPHVRKPLYSREGENIRISTARGMRESDGPFSDGPFIWQQYAPLPCFDGNYPVLGCWMIGDQACGLGIREDRDAITRDTSRFVPHYFTP